MYEVKREVKFGERGVHPPNDFFFHISPLSKILIWDNDKDCCEIWPKDEFVFYFNCKEKYKKV